MTGGWMTGWKTWAAAALAVLVAANQIFKWVSPDVEAAVLTLAAALGIVGIGHKLDKARAAVSSEEAQAAIAAVKARAGGVTTAPKGQKP